MLSVLSHGRRHNGHAWALKGAMWAVMLIRQRLDNHSTPTRNPRARETNGEASVPPGARGVDGAGTDAEAKVLPGARGVDRSGTDGEARVLAGARKVERAGTDGEAEVLPGACGLDESGTTRRTRRTRQRRGARTAPALATGRPMPSTADQLPRLPEEIWLAVCGYLRSADFLTGHA